MLASLLFCEMATPLLCEVLGKTYVCLYISQDMLRVVLPHLKSGLLVESLSTARVLLGPEGL